MSYFWELTIIVMMPLCAEIDKEDIKVRIIGFLLSVYIINIDGFERECLFYSLKGIHTGKICKLKFKKIYMTRYQK